MKEIWKDIKGYEGLYQVSNLGRVKSLPRLRKNNKGIYTTKSKYLKGSDNSLGYLRVHLKNNEIKSQEYIHRLVAIHFIDNPYKKPCVNHIDCNPSNNIVDNLEWCTYQENTDHMVSLKRNIRDENWFKRQAKARKKQCKKVIGTKINGNEVIIFNSMQEAQRNGFNAGGISECCSGKRKFHKGYLWRLYDREC